MLLLIQQGIKVNPKLLGSRLSRARKKDQVRAKVANARVRVNGLFVNKQKELLIEDLARSDYNLTDESETVDPFKPSND